MRRLKIMMKTTSECNLHCHYCSAGEAKKDQCMKPETACITLDKIIEGFPGRSINFTWTGGEPLLAGLDFYEDVIEYQKSKDVPISNMIQTNATLITIEWAKFFKKNNVKLGISLDGPKHVHDSNRIYKNGAGSFESLKRGTQILKDHKKRYTILGVINERNRNCLKETLYFMLEQESAFKLYTTLPTGRAKGQLADAVASNDLFDINKTIFDHWLQTGNQFAEVAIHKYLQSVLTGIPAECTFLQNCQEHFLGVNWNGDVYPCACFDTQLTDYCYGNVHVDQIEAILDHPTHTLLSLRYKTLPDKCTSDCEDFTICYGGCPFKAELGGNVNSEDPDCAQYKKIFSYMKKKILSFTGIECPHP